MDAQLKQLIDLQTEQNQLLKKHLWRFRFSLLALLLLTTVTCCCLGFLIYTQRTALRPAPAGTWSTPSGVTYAPANVLYPGDPLPVTPKPVPSQALSAGATPADAVPFPTSRAVGNFETYVE